MQIRFCLALFMLRIRPNTFNSLEYCPNAMAFFYFRIPSNLPPVYCACSSSPLPLPPLGNASRFGLSQGQRNCSRAKREEEKYAKKSKKPMTVAILMSLMMLSFWLIPILILYIRGEWGRGTCPLELLSITYLRTSVAKLIWWIANRDKPRPNRTYTCDEAFPQQSKQILIDRATN